MAWKYGKYQHSARTSLQSSHLEEEHDAEGREQRFDHSGVQIFPPGLSETQIKDVHVCLYFFEELHGIFSPPKAHQGLLCLLEVGPAGEVDGRLRYEDDTDQEQEDEGGSTQ